MIEREWYPGDRFIYHQYYTKKNGYGTVIRVEEIKVVAVLDDFPDIEVIFPSMSPYVLKVGFEGVDIYGSSNYSKRI